MQRKLLRWRMFMGIVEGWGMKGAKGGGKLSRGLGEG